MLISIATVISPSGRQLTTPAKQSLPLILHMIRGC